MAETSCVGEANCNWRGHSFSTRGLPPTPIALQFDQGEEDQLKTAERISLLKISRSGLIPMYDVSPMNDITVPSFSLEFPTQSEEACENVRPLDVVCPKSTVVVVDVKQ